MGIGQPGLENLVNAPAQSAPERILVTGNMGYVGASVVSRLREVYPDAELIGLDTGFFAHCLTGCLAIPERNLDRQYLADVRKVTPAVLDGVDAVVHLAAISNDPIGDAYDEITLAINHDATARLARLAKSAGVGSLVFAGSCSIYGAGRDSAATESSAPRPLTRYAESKWRAEQSLRELADESFIVTSLRFGTACGMSDRLRLDVVLNDFVASAIATGRITLLSDGMAWRPLIHVRDMARAIDWAVSRTCHGADHFLALNIGSDDWNYRIIDLAEHVASVIPSVEISVGKSSESDKRSYRVSFERYRALAPDDQPQMDLPTAIEDLVEGLARMGFADPDFRASPLIRLVALGELRERGLVNDRLEWTTVVHDYARAH